MLVSIVMMAQMPQTRWSELLTLNSAAAEQMLDHRPSRTGADGLARCEQSGTESRVWMCHHEPIRNAKYSGRPRAIHSQIDETNRAPCRWRKTEGRLTQTASGGLGNRFRRRLASVIAAFAKLFATLKPEGREFFPQRMCPFCGLITPRRGSSCLECGRRLSVV